VPVSDPLDVAEVLAVVVCDVVPLELAVPEALGDTVVLGL
jgi:hypothetical protein